MIFLMGRVGVKNVDILGHYHAPTPRYWQKNVTKIHRRNLRSVLWGELPILFFFILLQQTD